MLLFGTVFIFPLFAQISLGWTPTQTGVFMIPSALFAAFSMPLVGKMLNNGVNPKKIIIVGVIITFVFLMMLSRSSFDTSETDLYFPFALRGIGLAFMMSPILALAIGGLQGKEMTQAVALANMIRQLGGALGIALINVYLTHIVAENRNNMLSYINPYDANTNERLNAMKQNFMSRGYDMQQATDLAHKMLEGSLFRQYTLVSYNQGFLMVGVAILICIPITLLIRYKKPSKPTEVPSDH
jgi:DHA2 family multidrug resistance protein